MAATPAALELAQTLAQLAESKKGQQIRILDVSALHSLIDCFVLVTAYNARHGLVIGEEALAAVKSRGLQPWHLERAEDWICGDFGDVVLHVFTEEARGYYDLDHLWADAPEVAWAPKPSQAQAV
ncbi:MAG: ribosome silencing factor [Planctomycetota bacterium]